MKEEANWMVKKGTERERLRKKGKTVRKDPVEEGKMQSFFLRDKRK